MKQYGVRYSVLLQLPYFDVVQFHVIDAMHNLLLGTAKNMMHIWCENGILSSRDLQSVQYVINSIVVPVDVGRIPSNVASSFMVSQQTNGGIGHVFSLLLYLKI